MDSNPLQSQIDCTVELAQDSQPLPKWQKRDQEKMRAYRRKSYAKHREKNLARSRSWRADNRDRVRGYWDADKARAHEAFRQQFDAAREQERQDHLQMKAAQLRRSIIRDGVIAKHAIWDCNFSGMIDHSPVE